MVHVCWDCLSRHRRHNPALVSNICKAVLICLFWAPNWLNYQLHICFNFSFNLIGKLTMTCKSWHPWYTFGGPEQGYWCCFAGGINQKFSSVCDVGLPTASDLAGTNTLQFLRGAFSNPWFYPSNAHKIMYQPMSSPSLVPLVVTHWFEWS